MSTNTRDQSSAGMAPRRRRAPAAPPPKKKPRWGIRIMVALLIVMLAAAAYLGWLVYQTKGALKAIGDETVTEVAPEESVSVKPTTILILGLDARAQGGGLNTDVIKVAALNPNSKTSTIVSIPRDTRIELDGYKSNKANAYYARFYTQATKQGMSAEEARAEARRETKLLFSRYFDVPIDYTVVVNFDGFTDVVDALGGINVDVDMDMRYVDNADGTNINLTAGMQRLDGKKALDYVRYRKSNDGTRESNDVERNARQTQVIGAIADRMMSFSGVTKLGSVIEAVGDNIKSDMHWKEIENLGTTYFSISSSGIESIGLEGTWRSPYIHVTNEEVSAASAALQAKLAE